MRVVANRAFGKPENIFNTEIMLQRVLDVPFPEAGVAHLNFWVEITLLGGQQRAAAVHFNAAAFDNEGFAAEAGVEKFFAEQLGRRFGNLGVPVPAVVFRPAVEMEMNDGCFPPSAF